jgi:hypothetical protein
MSAAVKAMGAQPAFPTEMGGVPHKGITKREYISTAVLAACAAVAPRDNPQTPAWAAEWSVRWADALIAQLDRDQS